MEVCKVRPRGNVHDSPRSHAFEAVSKTVKSFESNFDARYQRVTHSVVSRYNQWACPDESNCCLESSQTEMVDRLATALTKLQPSGRQTKSKAPRVRFCFAARIEVVGTVAGSQLSANSNTADEKANWMVDSRRETPKFGHRIVASFGVGLKANA